MQLCIRLSKSLVGFAVSGSKGFFVLVQRLKINIHALPRCLESNQTVSYLFGLG